MLKSGLRAIVNKQFKKKNYATFMKNWKTIRVCLVTVFFFFSPILCFQKQFSVFETKKLVWESKIDRKQKLFLKLNL